MSSRKPGYLIGVILLALVMSAPQILVLLQTGAGTFFGIGSLPFRSRLLGVGSPVLFGGSVWSAAFWRDRLVFISDIRGRKDGTLEWVVSTIDVETGKITDLDLGLTVPHGIVPVSIGDRLWFASHNGAMPVGSSFELVENALQRVPFVVPISTAGDDQRFLLDGEPACVVATPGSGFQVSTFTAGKWGNNRDVVLPTRYGEETFNFKYHSHLSCLNHGDGTHVFLHYGLRLFHRDGLELQAVDATGALLNGGTGHSATAVNEAVSALRVANSDGATTGWTLVRETPNALPTIFHSNQDLFGMVVGGQPAAMIVDDSGDFQPVGHLYRFDGTAWSEFATQTFPFGTNQIRVLPGHSGQKSFVVTTSRTGATHIYAVETTGFRPTNGASQHNNSTLNMLRVYAMVPLAMLVLGILLGLGTSCLMWWSTKPDYSFGVQTVKLASVGRRGLARLIDLALIVFSTAGLGWTMTRGFDWISFIEALHLYVDHPTIPVATRVASILALWLVVLILSLLIAQARLGLTPGKWLCGLRTLRTTLRPCGFARSLVREVVLGVDAGNFLCWTPGILSIAFTDHRQRLGDLVADTLVVEARSLK